MFPFIPFKRVYCIDLPLGHPSLLLLAIEDYFGSKQTLIGRARHDPRFLFATIRPPKGLDNFQKMITVHILLQANSIMWR